jgi:hypothetical protein
MKTSDRHLRLLIFVPNAALTLLLILFKHSEINISECNLLFFSFSMIVYMFISKLTKRIEDLEFKLKKDGTTGGELPT